jgi:RND family efflux transporter MFP subunit
MKKIAAVVMFLTFLVSACQSNAEEQTEGVSESAALAALPIPRVQTFVAASAPLSYQITSNGKVVSHQQAALSFLVSGSVSQVLVANGRRVGEGAVLAVLEDSEFRLALERARTETAMRLDEYRKLFVEYGGTWGVPHSLSDTLAQILRVRSGLALAEVSQAEAERRLENTRLKAPFSGVLSDWYLSKGTQIQALQALGTLYTDTQLAVETYLPESQIGVLQKGIKAQITPLAGNPTYVAELVDLNPAVEREGLVRLRFALPAQNDLLLGMNVRLLIEIPQSPQLLVPKEAIVLRSEKEVVFTLKNGRAFWNYVKKGKENSRWVEILEGLQAGDEVIISNNLQLSHDAKVEVEKNK